MVVDRNNQQIVFSFTPANVIQQLGKSEQGTYLFWYLKILGAKTCVLENQYIDHDYMIDYQKYHSRSFDTDGNITKRLHFFAIDFSEEKFQEYLQNNDVGYLQKPDSYLGFVVIRPITNKYGFPLIGRTLVKTYPKKVEGENYSRHFLTCEYPVSLYGIPLKIDSLPFQAQDTAASACATIALWIALQPLVERFQIPRYAPAEITEMSTTVPGINRTFPSRGLTIEQMVNYIRSVGLEVETIVARKKDVIPLAVKIYINAGFPLIAKLKIKCKSRDIAYHAVVITGYKCDDLGNVTEFYIHDDNIGPFSDAKPTKFTGFKYWKNTEWNKNKCRINLVMLLIPIYPKIRLTFNEIHTFYQKVKNKYNKDGWEIALSLESVQHYKNFLLQSSIENKENMMRKFLPRFLWIITFYYNGKRIRDYILDAIATFPKILGYAQFL